ncbi:MAG: hypothetical protein CNLJKLNK_00044 [Holosporales bacterium]
MFKIDKNIIGSFSHFEKIKLCIKKMCQFDFLYNRPNRYLLIRISPMQIQIHLINDLFCEQEGVFFQNAYSDILSFLNLHKNLPVYCVLNGWEMDIKMLNLNNANILDRYLAQSHFAHGAFEKSHIVISRPSQNKDIYHFINLHNDPTLNEILKNLSKCKNTFIGFDLEEILHFRRILPPKNPLFNAKKLHILFKKTQKTWQILVNQGHDLILCRNGSYDGYFNFTQEILNTINYLPTLGIDSKLPSILYSEPETFSRIVLAQNSIDLIELDDMEQAIFQAKPESMIYNIFNKIKYMNFMKTSPYFKEFFYHRFFYEFAKNSFIFQVGFSIFLITGLGMQMGRIAYFQMENEHITQQINATKHQEHRHADQLIAHHLFPYYQKNPVIRIKELAKLLPDFLTVEKINFNQEQTIVHLKMKNQKGKEDAFKTLQATLENTLQLKVTIKKKQKDTFILTMK